MKRHFKAGVGTPRNLLRTSSRIARIARTAYKNILSPALREAAKEATSRTIMSGIQSAQDGQTNLLKIISKAFPSSKKTKDLKYLLSKNPNSNKLLYNTPYKYNLISPIKMTQKRKNSKTPSTPKTSRKSARSMPRRPRKAKKSSVEIRRSVTKISPLNYSKE